MKYWYSSIWTLLKTSCLWIQIYLVAWQPESARINGGCRYVTNIRSSVGHDTYDQLGVPVFPSIVLRIFEDGPGWALA